jgi:hypothetical protein
VSQRAGAQDLVASNLPACRIVGGISGETERMHGIELLGDLIHRNLVFVVALAIIPLKLIMLRVCQDKNAEMESILAIPEDLSYVTMGLTMSSLVAENGPLQSYFRGSAHVTTDIAIVLMMNAVLTIVVHKIGQSWTKLQYMNWMAALQVRGDQSIPEDSQLSLDLHAADENLLYIYLHHLSKFLISFIVQFSLVGFWLFKVAEVFTSQ